MRRAGPPKPPGLPSRSLRRPIAPRHRQPSPIKACRLPPEVFTTADAGEDEADRSPSLRREELTPLPKPHSVIPLPCPRPPPLCRTRSSSYPPAARPPSVVINAHPPTTARQQLPASLSHPFPPTSSRPHPTGTLLTLTHAINCRHHSYPTPHPPPPFPPHAPPAGQPVHTISYPPQPSVGTQAVRIRLSHRIRPGQAGGRGPAVHFRRPTSPPLLPSAPSGRVTPPEPPTPPPAALHVRDGG